MSEMQWTGERLVTEIVNSQITLEHLHRYALAIQISKDKVVLDIASGEGYGSNLIKNVAIKVYGVDISEEAIQHSKEKYNRENLEFKIGSTSKIPLGDSSVEVVISFETLEHHDEHNEMMNEIKRVLKPGGILLISSPEKINYSKRNAGNPFHIKELELAEFSTLLKSNFKNVKIYDQRLVYGSIISPHHNSIGFSFFDGDYNAIENTIQDVDEAHNDISHNKPYFNLALASDADLSFIELPDTSFFNGIEVLYLEKREMDKKFENLRIGYNDLLRAYEDLNVHYRALQTNHEALNANYGTLNSSYEEFKKKSEMSLQEIKYSHSYRVGNFLVKPFSALKTLLKQ